ncbi:hypothetical protein [Sphingomonas montanisoli]|uniref:Nucleotide-diphospho-sugar transferase domain-containing protein n=1 Tax=Sphingomonas montanisoli TaxID=2606412 RepID=A0A5D9C9E9_9SPHN|nr:hypothetical protein [Sphingomonas montanisoli]TZG27953.1 hypothetical protein FYJ91_10455 [Sphingomonas montanisoli]
MSERIQAIFLQTADPFNYLPMLQETAKTVIEYCRRARYGYESYVGIKRGVWPWQATYNRIHQLNEIMTRGFHGWLIYLDADAYVVDLDFDLESYLRQHNDRAAILTPSMATDHHWDINAGVVLINLGHPLGREIVSIWTQKFAALSDERLAAAEQWLDADSDQDMIQCILRERDDIASAVYLQATNLINSSFATFIRQHLRSYTQDFAARLRSISGEVEAVLDGRSPDDPVRGSSTVGAQIVDAVYRGLLRRDADDAGRQNAMANLEHLGINEGLPRLLNEVMGSEEFANNIARS